MSMTRLTPKLHSLTTLVSPKSSNCNISISNGPIAFKFYTEWRIWSYIKKMSMTRLTPKLHSLTTLVSPKSSNCNISISNGPIAFKFYTGVKNPKLHKKKLSMTRLTPKLHFADDTCIPQIFKMQYLHE